LVRRAWVSLTEYKDEQDLETIPARRQIRSVFDQKYQREEDDVLIYGKMVPFRYEARKGLHGLWLGEFQPHRPTLIVWAGKRVYSIDYKLLRRSENRTGAVALTGLWTNLLQYEIGRQIEDRKGFDGRSLREKVLNKRYRDHSMKRSAIAQRDVIQRALEQHGDDPAPDLSPAALRGFKS
jgi:hypothetical protein